MIEFNENEKKNSVLAYTESKLQEVGKLETPCVGNMYSSEELLMLFNLAKEDRTMAITYALCIGFANGIKYVGRDKDNHDQNKNH